MKRHLLTIAILLISILTFGQKEIINTKTANHKQIKGSKIFIIPPEGFVEANNFQGFQQSTSSSSIILTEIPGPFSNVSKGLDESGLKSQGMTLKEKKEITINGYEGHFLKSEQFAYENYFTKYILAFGNSTTTLMIIGIFPQNIKVLDKEIVNSLYSVVYEPNLEVDIFGSVNFKIDTENTKFKFGKLIMGSLLYTVDGKVPTESEDKSSLSVGQSFSNVEITDKKLYCLNITRKLAFNNIKITEENIKSIEIDGISGYEIIATGTNQKSSREELIYQVMLFSDNGYYIILGNSDNNFQENTEVYKTIALTFKRK